MITTSPEIKELVAALHAAQGKLEGVHKDRANPHFKSRYATFENVCDTIRPVLGEHGLVWTQHPGAMAGSERATCISVTTRIMHVSGQWMESTFVMPLVKVDPQGTGSAVTYALRYSLMAILGLPPTDDDDANAASPPPRQRAQAKPIEPAPQVAPKAKALSRADYTAFEKAIREHTDIDALRVWWGQNSAQLKTLPAGWYAQLYEECATHAERLKVMTGEGA